MLKSPITWFVILVASCLFGPYILGVAPKTRRQWTYVAIVLAFIAWILPMMASLRSQ